MKKNNQMKGLSLLLCAALAAGGCGAGTQAETETAGTAAVAVEAVVPEVGTLTVSNEFVGTVSPKQQVNIIPLVSGEVDGVYFDVGDEVQAGDVLFHIDDEAAALQLESAQLTRQSAEVSAQRTLGSGQVLNNISMESNMKSIQYQIDMARDQYNSAVNGLADSQEARDDLNEAIGKIEDSVDDLEDSYQEMKSAVSGAKKMLRQNEYGVWEFPTVYSPAWQTPDQYDWSGDDGAAGGENPGNPDLPADPGLTVPDGGENASEAPGEIDGAGEETDTPSLPETETSAPEGDSGEESTAPPAAEEGTGETEPAAGEEAPENGETEAENGQGGGSLPEEGNASEDNAAAEESSASEDNAAAEESSASEDNAAAEENSASEDNAAAEENSASEGNAEAGGAQEASAEPEGQQAGDDAVTTVSENLTETAAKERVEKGTYRLAILWAEGEQKNDIMNCKSPVDWPLFEGKQEKAWEAYKQQKQIDAVKKAMADMGYSAADLGEGRADSALQKFSEQISSMQSQAATLKSQKASLESTIDSAESGKNTTDKTIDFYEENLKDAQTTYGIQNGQAYQDTQAAMQTQIQSADVGVKSAQMQLEFYTVTAPISGKIVSMNVEEYGMVQAGYAACVISNQDAMNVNFYVSEAVKNTLQPGMKITLTRNDNTYQAAITEIGEAVDPQTGLFAVEAVTEVGAEALASGVTVKIQADTYQSENTILIPYDAVYFESGQAYVYTVADGNAVRTEVETGIYNEEEIEIVSGLDTESVVIKSWSAQLEDGVPVRVIGDPAEETAD